MKFLEQERYDEQFQLGKHTLSGKNDLNSSLLQQCEVLQQTNQFDEVVVLQ
jgi:hypothetical protein